MKRYLVTGAAGFIASKVIDLLLQAGHQVVGVDNLNDAYDTRLKRWRLAQFEGNQDFRFHQLDIADREAISARFKGDSKTTDGPSAEQEPYSAVINLAARAGVRPSVENPQVYYQTNCDGVLNLLDLCRDFAVAKFVQASTSSLYGAGNRLPYTEDDNTDRPLSPYAASKKAAETLAYTYHHLHGLDITAFRYFTVYGPAGRPDMSVFRFVRRIAEGEPIVVFGDGTQSRDFTYVDDIARGTVAGTKPFGYEVINLGSDRPVKLSAIIEQIGQLLGREPIIEYLPGHPADVPATWANVEKAHQLLDWTPQISIEEGLQRCVDWYRENRDTLLPIELGDR